MADQDPDDPQLKALRAVWLSMRDSDEDPPDSGVSALMAAARSQAMHMTPKPWWKRMFEQLRRPPVLALATLLVLIGGAVLMTKRDTIEKAPTTAPAPSKELPATNLDIGGAAPAQVTPVVPSKADNKLESAHKPKDEPNVERTAPPPVRPHPTSHNAGKGVESPPSADPGFAAGATTMDLPPAPVKRPSAKADSDLPPNHVLVDQLAAQARGAAKRGDCENAKAIATRIAGQDAVYYREHVAGDLAKCVSTPAAAADAAE